MSTSLPKPVTLQKDDQIWQLCDSVHVAAFLASGWKLAEEKQVEAQAAKRAKAKR